ncbi:Crp/Fnr family transcriptional regulator [Frankia sp. R82]|uniref:Crp/Fnr family transcriptional regulator n=1 Tax=Frankia sp. R82 TaxID=2950553 RepID=UPI00204424F7|nr:Crp/Fnr family transcriptional regulator [Frankia sp. R82]MCM3885555.1 Crp/Fnr family transcriptional regulator [Frankia sp. R82]
MPRHPRWPGHTFLGRLEEAVAAEAVGLGSPRRFDSAEHLLQEGETSDHVLLVLGGMVKVLGGSSSGDVLLALRVAGDVIGELAGLGNTVRIATVVACHVVVTRRISITAWEAFLQRNPPARTALAGVLADRLATATRRQVELSGDRPAVRVVRILAELTSAYGRPDGRGLRIDVALTQAELAGAAGCSEALLREILKELREASVLATGYRRYVILDPAELTRRAAPVG